MKDFLMKGQTHPGLFQDPNYASRPPQAPPSQEIIFPSASSYGRNPQNMKCPFCQEQIQTSTESKPGTLGE